MTSLIIVGVFAVAAGIRDVSREADQRSYDACVSRWADGLTERSAALGMARRGVDDASDDLWRTFARLLTAPGPDARDEFGRHLAVYVTASDNYRASVAQHPAPQAPRLACG